MAEEQQDFSLSLASELNIKLRDLEEKHRLLKERTLLIGQNLVESKEGMNKELVQLRIEVEEMKQNMEKIKSSLLRFLEEIDKRARKSELDILTKQMKMFQPFLRGE
ncbi:MAG: hypothetical protein AABX71_01520 [Nanoarchaeota archaeon]